MRVKRESHGRRDGHGHGGEASGGAVEFGEPWNVCPNKGRQLKRAAQAGTVEQSGYLAG